MPRTKDKPPRTGAGHRYDVDDGGTVTNVRPEDAPVAEPEAAEQMPLVPAEPPAYRDMDVPLDWLRGRPELIGRPPKRALVRDMKLFGALRAPVELLADPRLPVSAENVRITEGRRRVAAALKLGWESVSARVWLIDPLQQASLAPAMTISAHSTREENAATLLAGIVELMEKGYSDRQIASDTGEKLQRIARIRRLTALHPALRDALFQGRLAQSVAEAACHLPMEAQERLAQQYQEKRKITARDVQKEREVGASAILATLPLAGISELSPKALATPTAPSLQAKSLTELLTGQYRASFLRAVRGAIVGASEVTGDVEKGEVYITADASLAGHPTFVLRIVIEPQAEIATEDAQAVA